MKNVFKLGMIGACIATSLVACKDGGENPDETPIGLQAHSKTPNFLRLEPEFSGVKIYPILSSEDKLEGSPKFVYGSMADGAGLLKNGEGYTLINNIEADYSIARVQLDKNLKPISGEYILNSEATGGTAQCSGSLITPEEHGFGPLYLSGGEWSGSLKGVFVTNPSKSVNDASIGERLNNMGEWSVENAVAIGKDAYENKTVVFIGDDDSNGSEPSGQLAMYVGDRGDLNGGKLYGLKVEDTSVINEADMKEGTTYSASFVELTETELALLGTECKNKGVMGFSRLEDIDWRRGSAANNREIYFCVTGKKELKTEGGSKYGRIYKVVLNETDPTGTAKITCVLDGDNLEGKAKAFHSPDNILVTQNYAYIQEDPNGYFDDANKQHKASLYQYDLRNGALKKVLECDQVAAEAKGYGTVNKTWEITGMIDISETIGLQNTMLLITQNHGWDKGFTDPKAYIDGKTASSKRGEGSVLHVIRGLGR